MMLHPIKVRRLALQPSAFRNRLRDDEPDRRALEIVAVSLDENPSGLEQARRRDAARLVQLQGLEQTGDQRWPEVRLVIRERIREREFLRRSLRNPRRDLLRWPQGVVH